MKRQLCLMRHAKSNWDCDWLDDIERPLNPRGKRDAPRMARRLDELAFMPELILSSPASRAYTTARIVAAGLAYDPGRILIVEEIYEAMTREIVDIVERVDPGITRLMLFGHNPTFTAAVNRLTGSDFANVPTAGASIIEFEGADWKEGLDAGGHLLHFEFPKGLSS